MTKEKKQKKDEGVSVAIVSAVAAIIVAAITAIGSIIVARTNIQQADTRARQELLPTISALETKIIILNSTSATGMGLFINNVEGKDGELIEAPYAVLVKGTALIPDDLYVYLVVNDSNADYVQPNLRQNPDGTFEGDCYLGEENDPDSINKTYRVFAVITDQKYGTSAPLDRSTVKAYSNTIHLYRTR